MLSNFRGQTKRRTFREQFCNYVPTKLRNTTVAVALQIDRKHYKNCHRHLNLNGSFFLLRLSFRGMVVPNMVWTLLGPSSHFAVLCLLVSSRLSSALLPVTWELIWAHCLQACLNSWNASGGERNGDRRGEERLPQAPQAERHRCALCCSPLPVPSDVSEEWHAAGASKPWNRQIPLFVLHFPDLCLLSLLCSCSELERRRFSKWPAAFFVYPTRRWQGCWASLALTGHFQIKGPACEK